MWIDTFSSFDTWEHSKNNTKQEVHLASYKGGIKSLLDEVSQKTGTNFFIEKKESQSTMNEREQKLHSLLIEQVFKNELKQGWYPEWFFVKEVMPNRFVFIDKKDGNANYFFDESWEIILNIAGFSANKYTTPTAEILAGVKRVDEEAKKNVIYKIIWVQNGEAVYANTPLNITSKEYYHAWMDIRFLNTIQLKNLWLKSRYKEEDDGLKVMINSWAFRIDDLEFYLKIGRISQEQFDTFLPKIFEKLPSQCGDRRFSHAQNVLPKWYGGRLSRMKDSEVSDFLDNYSIAPIKESDLKRYFEKYKEKGLTPQIVQACYYNLPANMKDIKK